MYSPANRASFIFTQCGFSPQLSASGRAQMKEAARQQGGFLL
jgi:hypothetical protein